MSTTTSTEAPVTPAAGIRGVDIGLLLIRLMVGAVGVFHGSQKLIGAFGGSGPEGFAAMLAKMEVPQPLVSAYLAACAEFFGGLMMALGILTRFAAVPFLITMGVAVVKVHHAAFSLQHGGMEYALTLAVIALALIISGPGKLAIYEPRWRS